MNKIISLIPIFALAVVLGSYASEPDTNNWGMLTNGIQLSIRLKGEGNKLVLNQPVELQMGYRNMSTNVTFVLYNTLAVTKDPTYWFSVVSPSGKDISHVFPKIMGGSSFMITVGPNETKEMSLDLRQLCNFDELGEYKILAKRMVLLNISNRWIQVVSNPLALEIVPGEWKPAATNSPAGEF